MLSRGTILTVALRITAVSSMAELSFENWFCGTDTMTRMISYNSMYLDAGGSCWKYAARVNHCCAIHDNCYGLQLGRENCDQNFCDCLRRATAPDICAATVLKCLATIEGGQQAYLDSATYKEPLDFVKIVPLINGIEKEFLLLYQECPQVMETIKSCSLLTNICIKNEDENCEHHLSECVQQAADLQNSQQCREATHQAQLSLKSKTIHRSDIERKSTSTTAEDKSSATSTRASPHKITSEHHNQHDPSTSSLGVRTGIETKSTKTTAEDKTTATSTPAFPGIITSGQHAPLQYNPFTYGLGAFLIVVALLIILAFYLNFVRSQDRRAQETEDEEQAD